MILTKQLQVVIQSSLAQGRDYEDVRNILLKQGFEDGDISELFSQYRGSDVKGDSLGDALPAPAAPAPILKPDFVPVGYSVPQKDMKANTSAQDYLQSDVQKFMNVGTNTQTASDILMRQQTASKLPAPGTTLTPNEIANQTAHTTPKVLNDTGVVEGEVAPVSVPTTPTKIQAQQYINVGFAGMPEMEKVLTEEQAKKIEKSPWPLVFVLVTLLFIFGGFFYWFFFINVEKTSSDILDKLVKPVKTEEVAPTVPEYTGPRDPFTNLPLEVK